VTERSVIDSTPTPATIATLTADLRTLGIGEGDVLIVHTALSKVGWVIGGPQAVVQAMLDVVGPIGTVTMPGHSGGWSEPSHWENPPVPEAWWPTVRAEWPAFDARLTPLREMGAVAETFHRHPDTLRSAHPRVSHLANGPHAAAITANHAAGSGLGDESPLARLHELHATIVLIGVGHGNNTSLHLAEHRADWPGKAPTSQGSAVMLDGERQWVTYDELELDTDDFDSVGADFEQHTGLVRRGRVGQADSMVMPMRALVDHATTWFAAHRGR
jgi:aminoglycoside 3-N-acetyltransferase